MSDVVASFLYAAVERFRVDELEPFGQYDLWLRWIHCVRQAKRDLMKAGGFR